MNKDAHQYLLKELELVNNRVVVLTTIDTKLMNILLLIFGVGFGFGISSHFFSDYLLIFFPIAVYCIIYYFIHLYIIVTSLLGYKKALEEYINNNIIFQRLLISELINEKFHLKSKGLYFSYFGYSILVLLSIYSSINAAFNTFDILNSILVVIGHIILLILLIISLKDLFKTFNKACEYSIKTFGIDTMNKQRQ